MSRYGRVKNLRLVRHIGMCIFQCHFLHCAVGYGLKAIYTSEYYALTVYIHLNIISSLQLKSIEYEFTTLEL